jgi:alanyl-tRNA synthetase
VVIADNGSRYSYELCGGVHVAETAEIGQMVVISEGSVSAGIRRVEALTGRAAREYIQDNLNTLNVVAQRLGTTPEHSGERLEALQDELAVSKKEIAALRREIARYNFNRLMDTMDTANGVPALVAEVEDVTMDNLRDMSDWFRNKVSSGVLVLGTVVDERPQLLVAVTDDLTKQGLHAGKLIKEIAEKVGGGGGGRPNLAQAGGKDADQLAAALDHARQLIASSHQA